MGPGSSLDELDNLLWRDVDNISIKKLWEYLCTYCYLPRLASESVLEETIRAAEFYGVFCLSVGI